MHTCRRVLLGPVEAAGAWRCAKRERARKIARDGTGEATVVTIVEVDSVGWVGGAPDLAAEEALEGTLKKYPFTHVLHTEHRESEYCTLL